MARVLTTRIEGLVLEELSDAAFADEPRASSPECRRSSCGRSSGLPLGWRARQPTEASNASVGGRVRLLSAPVAVASAPGTLARRSSDGTSAVAWSWTPGKAPASTCQRNVAEAGCGELSQSSSDGGSRLLMLVLNRHTCAAVPTRACPQPYAPVPTRACPQPYERPAPS